MLMEIECDEIVKQIITDYYWAKKEACWGVRM